MSEEQGKNSEWIGFGVILLVIVLLLVRGCVDDTRQDRRMTMLEEKLELIVRVVGNDT